VNGQSFYEEYELITYRIAYIVLLFSFIWSLIFHILHVRFFQTSGKIIFIGGTLALTLSIVFRYFNLGRLPFIHSYEIYLLLGWLMLLIALIADTSMKNSFSSTFTSLFVGAMMIYVEGQFDRTANYVMPALQSNWLAFHVITTMIGYAAFSIGFLAAEAYIVSKTEWLEELSYKLSALGFPFLTIGIASGAIWAQEAWGKWWGWDPKETASLIMWLVYAAYLHMRLVKGWRGSKAAVMNIIGFISMIFCFIGLNWLASVFETGSQHVYSEGSSKMQYFIYMVLIIAVIVFIGGLIIRYSKPNSNDSE
jgi:ABC-type transport system involved in cytochrome c biogenesis permease subunit